MFNFYKILKITSNQICNLNCHDLDHQLYEFLLVRKPLFTLKYNNYGVQFYLLINFTCLLVYL